MTLKCYSNFMVTNDRRRAQAYDVFNPHCPSRQVLDRIGDRWTALIVLALLDGTKRFGELRASIGGASPKVLTAALRALERDGLLQRHVYAEVPPRVEYTLTPLGRSLERPLKAIRDWAVEYVPEIESNRRKFSGEKTSAS